MLAFFNIKRLIRAMLSVTYASHVSYGLWSSADGAVSGLAEDPGDCFHGEAEAARGCCFVIIALEVGDNGRAEQSVHQAHVRRQKTT